MVKNNQIIGLVLSFFSLVGASAFTLSATAAVAVAPSPLFVSAQATPNVIMVVDDSGSMDFEILVPTNDGSMWWNTDNNPVKRGFVGWGTNSDYSGDLWVGGGQFNFNQSGLRNATWKKFSYLFPNGNAVDKGGRVLRDSGTHYAVPPLPSFAYARSAEHNKAYFDPLESYAPWPSVGGKTFGNIVPTAAPADPGVPDPDVYNLTEDFAYTGDDYKFRVYSGMFFPVNTKVYFPGNSGGGSWVTLTASGTVPFVTTPGSKRVDDNVSYAISYYPATFYTSRQLPASYGYTAVPPLAGYAPGASSPTLYRYEIKASNFASSAAYTAAMQNFANWFSYYRKRQLATRGGIAASFKDIRAIRAGTFRINNRTAVTMRDLSQDAERAVFFDDILKRLEGGGTPNREALNFAGQQFMRADAAAPIQFACQSNAAILFTDGFSYATTTSGVDNADGGQGEPYADTASNTIADIAMHYYKTPLRTGAAFPGKRVPVSSACNAANHPADLDCNSDLHMLTYGVTLGSRGILFNPDASPAQDPYTNPPQWWTSFTDANPRAVDDLWHATINGRGEMLNAKTPTEVSSTIKSALNNILAHTGSASAVATNSTRIDTNSYVYQAKFDSADWSGELLAYSVLSGGAVGSLAWTTNDTLTESSARNIATWNGSAGIDFTLANWASLSQAQRDALNNGEAQAVGQARLQWLRGSSAQEQRNGGSFRNRERLLGDIVNSDPLFVAGEDFGYSHLPGAQGAAYADYVSSKASRAGMLYVGANDGMLHAFNAANGSEVFAFIPQGVYGSVGTPKLAALTSPGYSHQYFVDASPRASDAYINGSWKTILVGATGAGGRSVFAIDVTAPGSLAANKVLWEFSTVATDANKLGISMSQPVIAKLATGQWVAIFGNGYNSSDNVKLFVVDLASGQLIKALDTGLSGVSNGLSAPVPVDVDGDRIADYVYAGDLQGNMWKFDFTGNSSNQWGSAYRQGSTPRPLFTALDSGGVGRAITASPVVGRHPEGGLMVYFGTGKYFEVGDNVVGSTPQLQAFYGIRDNGVRVTNSTTLQEQSILQEGVLSGFGPYRTTTARTVDYANKNGWYINLQSPSATNGRGERVVSRAILRFGRIIFTSIIPSQDVCAYGGSSWIMELDAVQGGRLAYSVFDINGDGAINEEDFVTLPDGTKGSIGGKGYDEIIKTPSIIAGEGDLETKYTSGSSGTLGNLLEQGAAGYLGRQSWRQLR